MTASPRGDQYAWGECRVHPQNWAFAGFAVHPTSRHAWPREGDHGPGVARGAYAPMTKPSRSAAFFFLLTCVEGCAGGGSDTSSGSGWSGDDAGETGTTEGGFGSFPSPSPDAASYAPESGTPCPGSSSGSGSGGGYYVDSGGGKGNNPPSQGSQGCLNPACTTDGNNCGCTATGSTGNVVALGCLQGGVCGCFDDTKTLRGGLFFDNGACGSSTAAAQAFVQYCQCN
jgi:hypothetical protein